MAGMEVVMGEASLLLELLGALGLPVVAGAEEVAGVEVFVADGEDSAGQYLPSQTR